MAYTKTSWVDGTTEITAARLNNLESQHELALVDARADSGNPLKVEILASLPAAGTKGRVVFNTGDNKFYFDNGTAWNVAAVTNIGQQTITPATTNQTITEGYHNGTGYVHGDADLVAGNIKDGVSIFGVSGTHLDAASYYPNCDVLYTPYDLGAMAHTAGGDSGGGVLKTDHSGVGPYQNSNDSDYFYNIDMGSMAGYSRIYWGLFVFAAGGRFRLALADNAVTERPFSGTNMLDETDSGAFRYDSNTSISVAASRNWLVIQAGTYTGRSVMILTYVGFDY